MTRSDQNDEEGTARQGSRDVVVEFSNYPHVFRWEESTPSQSSETKTSDQPAQVRAIVDAGQPAPLPKRIANRYDVIGVLGVGGQADVYLAEDTTLQRKVAIKISKPGRPLSDDEQQQFRQEARSIASLRHPGIVTVHDFGIHDDGRCFIVLEYLPGQSLKDCLNKPDAKQTFTIERTINLISRVAEALHYAHQRGIYHRDLKPGNILLDEHGNPHITDFGLAVTQESQRGLKGEVAGTVPYMAPEQVRGEAHWLNGQADIWALGVILYEMLAGRRPFQGKTEDEVKEEILRRTPTPLRQIDDAISKPLEGICNRCLRKSTADRFSSAIDIVREFQSPGASQRITAPEQVQAPQLAKGAANSKRTLLVLASIGVVIVGLVFGYSFGPWRTPTNAMTLGRWRDLSVRSPRKLAFANSEERARIPVATDTLLQVSSRDLCLLELTDQNLVSYELEFQMSQTQWKTNASAGVYFQTPSAKDDPPGSLRIQVLRLSSNPSSKTRPISMRRELMLAFPSQLDTNGEVTLAPNAIDTPVDMEWITLHVRVEERRIVAVRVNGKRLPDLTTKAVDDTASFLVGGNRSALDCRGGIGFYVNGHNSGVEVTFREVRIKPLVFNKMGDK